MSPILKPLIHMTEILFKRTISRIKVVFIMWRMRLIIIAVEKVVD